MPFVADRKELARLKENKGAKTATAMDTFQDGYSVTFAADVLVEIESNDIMKRYTDSCACPTRTAIRAHKLASGRNEYAMTMAATAVGS